MDTTSVLEPSWRRKYLSLFSRTRQGPQYRGASEGIEASSPTNTYLADIKAAESGWVLRTWWGGETAKPTTACSILLKYFAGGSSRLSRNSPGTVRGALNTALKTERRVLSLGMEQRPKITRGRCWNQSELASRERKAALSDRWNCSMSPLLFRMKACGGRNGDTRETDSGSDGGGELSTHVWCNIGRNAKSWNPSSEKNMHTGFSGDSAQWSHLRPTGYPVHHGEQVRAALAER